MPLIQLHNWDGRPTQAVRSKAGLWAFPRYADNVVRPACVNWPPHELIQKLCRSDKVTYFRPDDQESLKAELGYYCDLQSIHNEDAMVWSYFGPLAYSEAQIRAIWYEDFARLLRAPRSSSCDITLWRRVPHPDNAVPGGPEIDVFIQTRETVIMVEAKWRGSEGLWQGANGMSSQTDLRHRFGSTIGKRVFVGKEIILAYLVLDASQQVQPRDNGPRIAFLKWRDLCGLEAHPLCAEMARYYDWKRNLVARKEGVPAPG